MSGSNSRRIPLILFLTFIFGAALCLFTPAVHASHAPSASQSANSDLICHTDKAEECYPRIFQPTDEFQTVKDDQEIPNGLHIRLNIYTGQKEAKINVPVEHDPSLDGLPSQHGIVVVDSGEPEYDSIPKGAPEYEAVGKIKESREDTHGFAEAVNILKSGVADSEETFDSALDSLEDMSHDIYYGLKIAEDRDVLQALFCLTTDRASPAINGAKPRDQQAAAILAGALQNNPTALGAVVKSWEKLMDSHCPATGASLRDEVRLNLIHPALPSNDTEKTMANRAKAKISVVNGLIKDASIRKQYLEWHGMEHLLEVLIPTGEEWAAAQRKAGQLALDNFLDHEMGAETGLWPKSARLSDEHCRSEQSRTDDGCWEFHVARIMAENKHDDGHWSRQVYDKLGEARRYTGLNGGHDEL